MPLSLGARVVAWLDRHPEEFLLTGDIATKFGVSRFTALDGMRREFERGRVMRRIGPGNEYEWHGVRTRAAAAEG